MAKGDCYCDGDGDAKAISEKRHPVASMRRQLSGAVSAFPAAMATLFRAKAIRDFNKSEPGPLNRHRIHIHIHILAFSQNENCLSQQLSRVQKNKTILARKMEKKCEGKWHPARGFRIGGVIVWHTDAVRMSQVLFGFSAPIGVFYVLRAPCSKFLARPRPPTIAQFQTGHQLLVRWSVPFTFFRALLLWLQLLLGAASCGSFSG